MSTIHKSLCVVALALASIPACAAPVESLDPSEEIGSAAEAVTLGTKVTCAPREIFFGGACRDKAWISGHLLSTGAVFEGAVGVGDGVTGMPTTKEMLVFQQRSATTFQAMHYTTASSPVVVNGYGVVRLWTTEYSTNSSGEPQLYTTRREPQMTSSMTAALVTTWWERTTWKDDGSWETCDSSGACTSAYAATALTCDQIGANAGTGYRAICQGIALTGMVAGDTVVLVGAVAGSPAAPLSWPAAGVMGAMNTSFFTVLAAYMCPTLGDVVKGVVTTNCLENPPGGDPPTGNPPGFPPFEPAPGPGGGDGDPPTASDCTDYTLTYEYTDPEGMCCTVQTECTAFGVDADNSCSYDCVSGGTVCVSASCDTPVSTP